MPSFTSTLFIYSFEIKKKDNCNLSVIAFSLQWSANKTLQHNIEYIHIKKGTLWKPFNHFTWEQIEVSNNKMLHLAYVLLYLHNDVKDNFFRKNMSDKENCQFKTTPIIMIKIWMSIISNNAWIQFELIQNYSNEKEQSQNYLKVSMTW